MGRFDANPVNCWYGFKKVTTSIAKPLKRLRRPGFTFRRPRKQLLERSCFPSQHQLSPSMAMDAYLRNFNQSLDNCLERSTSGGFFRAILRFQGHLYEGRSDISKEMAEIAACECALRLTKVLSEHEMENVEWHMKPPVELDMNTLTSEEQVRLRTLTILKPGNPTSHENQQASPPSESERIRVFHAMKKSGNELIRSYVRPEHPQKCLHDIYGRLIEDKIACDREGFTVTLRIGGHFIFRGTGSTKKAASAAAHRAALANLHDVFVSPQTGFSLPETNVQIQCLLRQRLADKVASLVDDKFAEFMRAYPKLGERKVIAGIVMTVGMDPDSARLICVTSGTKCVLGEYLPTDLCGSLVLDSHAEIVSKRCLRYVFMTEIQKCIYGNSSSIFNWGGNERFVLKSGINFHLYVSSLPCGDARVHAIENRMSGEKSGYAGDVGSLRTKVELCCGTEPVPKEGLLQTMDGISIGQHFRAMSCSDKIARLCVTGVQGGLLSQLLEEPVYFTSLVVGTAFNPDRLHTSLFERISPRLGSLPPGYNQKKLLFATKSSPEKRNIGLSPLESVNWINDAGLEVLNSKSGLQKWASDERMMDSEKVSRLSKASLFRKWVELKKDVERNLYLPDSDYDRLKYRDAKDAAVGYQIAKQLVNKAFHDGGYFNWVKKPAEVDSFYLKGLSSVNSPKYRDSNVYWF